MAVYGLKLAEQKIKLLKVGENFLFKWAKASEVKSVYTSTLQVSLLLENRLPFLAIHRMMIQKRVSRAEMVLADLKVLHLSFVYDLGKSVEYAPRAWIVWDLYIAFKNLGR